MSNGPNSDGRTQVWFDHIEVHVREVIAYGDLVDWRPWRNRSSQIGVSGALAFRRANGFQFLGVESPDFQDRIVFPDPGGSACAHLKPLLFVQLKHPQHRAC